ncbi:MAG TPA: hypothetical protein VH539_24475 [Gemmatimonadaceae bacterium]|jgi:hypothetical protein
MNRYVSVAAIVAIAAALGACDRGATSPKGALSATFDLKSINGTSLPVDQALGATAAAVRITSDVLVLRDNGSYEDSTTYSFPNGGTTQFVTTLERGQYSISGAKISFTDQTNGGRYGGTLDGTTLTQSVNGLTPVYERR